MQEIPFLNNIRLADVESIGVMKLEAMLRRSKFRDYYDIYSILKNGHDINKLIPMALEHSGYRLRTKGLLATLTNGELFKKEKEFELLQPVFDIDSKGIEAYIKFLLNTFDITLRNDVIDVIVRRTITPYSKAFSDEQLKTIGHFLDQFAVDSKKDVLLRLWSETIQKTEMQKANPVWKEDALNELLDIADGKTRNINIILQNKK